MIDDVGHWGDGEGSSADNGLGNGWTGMRYDGDGDGIGDGAFYRDMDGGGHGDGAADGCEAYDGFGSWFGDGDGEHIDGLGPNAPTLPEFLDTDYPKGYETKE